MNGSARGSHLAHLFSGLLVLGTALAASAGDWPRFRGPNGNSIVEDPAFNAAGLATAKTLWTAEVGRGYSAVAVAGGLAVTLGNDGEKDTIRGFDAVTGAEKWTHSYPSQPGNYPGPRGTPWIEKDRVYTLGYWGDACCLDAATGKVIWQKNLVKDTGAAVPQWGQASSPLLLGDRIAFNIGESGCVVEKATGNVVWSSKPAASGYATPLPIVANGKARLAVFGAKAIFVVDAADGTIVAKHPWETQYDVNAADPVYDGGRIFVSSGYGTGCALVDFAGTTPKEVWRNKAIHNHFSSTILLDGHLYGCDGNAGSGDLVCLDFATGAEKWRKKMGFGSLIIVNGRIVYFNEKGNVVVGKASPAGFQEEARIDGVVVGGKAWTAPVCAAGRLYLRNDKGQVACLGTAK